MTRPLLVALREVRTYMQDKADLAFSLLLPIAIFALMYGAFGGELPFHGTAHVVDEDRGIYSARFIERLDELDNVGVKLLSPSEADSKLERADLLLVLYIPQGFSDKLTSGELAQLVFKQRGHGGQEGQIVASLIRGVVEEIAQEFQVHARVGSALAGTGISQGHIEITVQRFLDREREHPIVEVRQETVGGRPDPVNQFLPGIVTMFVLFAITLTAATLVEERKKGTLERLLTTRLSVGQLFAGKFLANLSRGFVQTFILLALTYMVFQLFTPLSFIQSLVIALFFAATASALGLVIASIARSEDGATWIAVFFTMAMVMISDTFFPIAEGSVLYTISKVSINTYAIDAFSAIIVQGGSLADVGLELGVLAGVAAVGLVLSRILFRVMPGGK
ncbi:MAG: ABC transporter permease [Dehalococcoidia bacterium]|nr:Inner membrane transport permease YbhR [Chloroflexota bacterium]MBT9159701.1 Inner membrane transport permease YbhR [Chloroflexota bacterium]MBT9162721.1 Inner membrane transport permease YbhR [Chloroflexota bacterium]